MTSAQEKFARELVAGRSLSDSYRVAFPRSQRWKDGAVHSHASALAKVPEVAQLVERLRADADAEAIADCRELKIILSERIRAIRRDGGPTYELCRAVDSLARICGLLTPAALAVAVAPGPLSPEERERRINDILGIPNTATEKVTPEERRRRINEALGIPDPTPEERARRWREMLGWPVEDATPAPQPLPAPVPAPCEAEEVAPIAEDEDGDGLRCGEGAVPIQNLTGAVAVEPEPVAVEETPERRERLARILAYVQRRGASTRDEARAVALTFEGGSVIGSEADAVAEEWEAARHGGADHA